MIIVAASFVGGFIFLQLGVGTGGRRVQPQINVGVINGVEINYNSYYDVQNSIISQIRASGKDDLTEEDYDRIEQQTWNELVFEILIQQEIERRGIEVTDEEVWDFLLNNPPEFIRANEIFHVNGQFDPGEYRRIIEAPEMQPQTEGLKEWVRQMLPRLKLNNQVTLGIHFSDASLLRIYRERKEQVKVGYVFFDPASLDRNNGTAETIREEELLPVEDDPYRPSKDEVMSYYKAHEQEFVDPERVTLQYIELSTRPTKKDTLEAKNRAVALVERIQRGEDFGEIAREFSSDLSTSDQGGDLGYLKRGEMLSAMENVVFSMEVGEVSDPILTPRGWHIVKVDDRREEDKGEELKIRHILLPIKISLATRDSVYGLVRSLFDDIREEAGTFEQIAAKYNLSLKVTSPFTKNDFIPELGSVMNEASNFAFSRDVEAVSHSITRAGRVIVLRILEKTPERNLTFEEARAEITDILSNENKMEAVGEKADSILSEAIQNGSLRETAEANEIDYQVTPLFSRNDFVPNIGRGNAFVGYAHTLPEGTIGGPVKTERGYYLIEVLERKGIDMEAFEAAKEDLRTELINREKASAFERWLSNIIEDAEIEDNRFFFGYSS
jgi:peptidyl-prolyl cis-trans isomerase D